MYNAHKIEKPAALAYAPDGLTPLPPLQDLAGRFLIEEICPVAPSVIEQAAAPVYTLIHLSKSH